VRIVADRNIPYVAEAFAAFGEVVVLPAAAIQRGSVRDADVLLIRSTVRADAALLDGSRVRFVGTATIGFDHVDVAYLAARGIAWSAAPGSNADSVRQWWAQALLTECARRGVDPSSLTIGIVGVGAVGSRIERFCRALGPAPLLCDPPRARRESTASFVDLDHLLSSCDVVTLHVPLDRTSADATFHLIDAGRLALLRRGAWLINTSRGEVVDTPALERALTSARLAALLDVYEHEPTPAPSLVAACALATPHIAGHSLDGKAAATPHLRAALAGLMSEYSLTNPRGSLGAAGLVSEYSLTLPEPEVRRVAVETGGKSDTEVVLEVMRRLWRIEDDDAAMREMVRERDAAGAFRGYRERYAVRREPKVLSVELVPRRASAERWLCALDVTLV
jgi:erythronate-4-phosphate dehydrogenase